MDSTSMPPIAIAATPADEPEIVAGISSARGQPATVASEISRVSIRPGVLLAGAAALLGLVAIGIGASRLRWPAR